MSCKLDEYARDIVTTSNGKQVFIDTRWVPWPAARNCWETLVLPMENSSPNFGRELEIYHYETAEAADIGHAEAVNRWMHRAL